MGDQGGGGGASTYESRGARPPLLKKKMLYWVLFTPLLGLFLHVRGLFFWGGGGNFFMGSEAFFPFMFKVIYTCPHLQNKFAGVHAFVARVVLNILKHIFI